MKIKIRKGLFETNSSSVHCICIRNDGVNLGYTPASHKKINITGGNYGWGIDKLSKFDEKVNYIYQWCFYKDFILGNYENDEYSYCNKFKNFLMDNDIAYIYIDQKSVEKGYIENCSEWIDITLEELFQNNFRLLKKLLFNDASIIGIRNDNESYEFEEEKSEKYFVYLK